MTNAKTSSAKGFTKKDLEIIDVVAKTGFPIRAITQEEQDVLDSTSAHTPAPWIVDNKEKCHFNVPLLQDVSEKCQNCGKRSVEFGNHGKCLVCLYDLKEIVIEA